MGDLQDSAGRIGVRERAARRGQTHRLEIPRDLPVESRPCHRESRGKCLAPLERDAGLFRGAEIYRADVGLPTPVQICKTQCPRLLQSIVDIGIGQAEVRGLERAITDLARKAIDPPVGVDRDTRSHDPRSCSHSSRSPGSDRWWSLGDDSGCRFPKPPRAWSVEIVLRAW